MKLRFLIPFYILLASITFCGRKISDDNDAAQESPGPAQGEITNTISGKLELDAATDSIYANLWMKVPSSDFKYAGKMALETKQFKGVAFRYYDIVNNAPDNGSDSIQMHVVFSFKNNGRWKVKDSIRVMSLNEENDVDFEGLKPYFESRMDFFKNVPTTYPELLSFNNEWNRAHSSNPVYTVPRGDKSTAALPRITRDDNILSLKAKP